MNNQRRRPKAVHREHRDAHDVENDRCLGNCVELKR